MVSKLSGWILNQPFCEIAIQSSWILENTDLDYLLI